MEFKGTKGKWGVDGLDIYSESENELIEGNLICIAPEGFERSMVNWNANAKLIAAAREMFEMLKDVRDYLGSEKREEIDQLLTKITQ